MPLSQHGSPCPYCHKQIPSETTRKRHYYYCRAKHENPAPAKKRACAACVASKTRCNLAVPRCWRCEKKGVDCVYASSGKDGVSIGREAAGGGDTVEQGDGDDEFSFSLIASNGASSAHQSPSKTIEGEFIAKSHHTYSPPFQPQDYGSVVWPTLNKLNQIPPKISGSVPFSSDQLQPTRTNIFAPRWTTSTRNHPISDAVTLQLRILLETFRYGTALPPFIHCYQISDGMHISGRNILAESQSLIRKFCNATTPNEKSAAWSAIQQSWENVWFTHTSFDDWSLLAAQQSLLLFAILRATTTTAPAPEQLGTEKHSDLPFLVAMSHVAQALAYRIGGVRGMELSPPPSAAQQAVAPTRWEKWVFEEARRRCTVVFRVLTLLYDMSDAVSCSALSGYVILPLQMPEALWTARDRGQWEIGFQGVVEQASVFGLDTGGRLMKLRMVDEDGKNRLKGEEHGWAEWCSQAGGLGVLVATTALLLKE